MPLLPYLLARHFLFKLDPETAHEISMNALAAVQNTPLQSLFSAPRVHDPIELAGIRFPNRVGLAAGLDKNARCIDALGAMGFGFIEVGTVTPRAQPGNPKPRMFRLPKAQALINRLGFNNQGLDTFVNNVQHSALRRSPSSTSSLVLGLNIGKNAATPMEHAVDDYLTCLDGVYPFADYISINISSPNTKNLRDLQSDDALDTLLQAITQRRDYLASLNRKTNAQGELQLCRVPLFLKIAPDLDNAQTSAIAAALLRHGMDGVIATNTTLSRDAVLGQLHAGESGGLSGGPVLEMSNHVIRQLRAALGPSFPIIGVGGIMSANDAISKIAAGANVVQIYTGLIYHGPQLVHDAAWAIKSGSKEIL